MNNVELTYIDSESPGDCGGVNTTRTWTATDNCGNTTTASQTISMTDSEPPVIENIPGLMAIECPNLPAFTEPSVTDNCDENPVITYLDQETQDDCTLTIARTWIATDACGNSSTKLQLYQIDDTTAPEWTETVEDITIDCTDQIPGYLTPEAVDACDEEVYITYEDEVGANGCAGNAIERTWIAVDECGNQITLIQHITLRDDEAPVFEDTPQNITVDCNDNLNDFETPEVTDNCDDNVELTFEDSGDNDVCTGIGVTRTWTATDNCGNSTTIQQTIFKVDNQPPVISGVGDDINAACGGSGNFSSPTATDDCDDDVELTFEDVEVPGGCSGTNITRIWTAVDDCENSSTASQTLYFEDDENPVFMGMPGLISVDCPMDPEFTEPTVLDNCDDDVSITYADQITTNDCEVSIIRTWTATDNCENSATTMQIIQVVDDKAPIFTTVLEDISVDCSQNGSPQFDEPEGYDECSDNVELTYEDEILGSGCDDGMRRTWTIKDPCGNSASISQTIYLSDQFPPVIEGVGNDMTVECDGSLDFDVATATDNCDTDVEIDFQDVTHDEDDCQNRRTTRTWTATDDCGNISTISQTIFRLDTEAPNIY